MLSILKVGPFPDAPTFVRPELLPCAQCAAQGFEAAGLTKDLIFAKFVCKSAESAD